MKRLVKMPAVQGLPAGAVAGSIGICDLPIGYDYHELHVIYKEGATAGLMSAIFGDITVWRNDTAERTHSFTELDHANGVNGSQYLAASQLQGTAGTDREQQVPIYFYEPWRTNKASAQALAWHVDSSTGWKSFQVKIQTIAALSATGVVEVWAIIDDFTPPPKGQTWNIKKVYRTQLTASGADTEFGATFFPSSKGAYQAIYVKQPSGTGTIQYMTVRNNGATGVLLMDKVSTYQNINFLEGRGMVPSVANAAAGAFAYDIVFDSADPIGDAVTPVGNGLFIHPYYTTAAAGTGNMIAISEVLGVPD